MYKISEYSKYQAYKLGVEIKPSKIKNKKIDVYLNNKLVASIGDIRYNDYPSYLLIDKKLAEERRRLYKLRHEKDLNNYGKGYYEYHILW